MSHFSTFRLDQGRLCEALPLVRMAIPHIDRARWIDYFENLVRLDGGVLIVTAADDFMHGLAIYRPEEDLRLGRIVRVDAIVAFELNPANPVRQALCDAIEALRDSVGARGIILMIPERDLGGADSRKALAWEGFGFRRHGAALWRPERLDLRGEWSEAG